jgi:hypothetical protein
MMPRRIQSLISPRYNARRNFTISKDALLKERSLATLPPPPEPTLNLQDIIAQLRKVQHDQNNNNSKQRRQQYSNTADNVLQDMIRRLRRVNDLSPKEQQAELQDMLHQLQNVDSLGEHNLEQLQSVLDTLNATMMNDDNTAKSKKNNNQKVDHHHPHASRLVPEDHDWLQSALRRLKKAQLTPREANAVADTVSLQKLKHVELSDSEGEAESDVIIANLCGKALVYPTRKAYEVTQVLQGLRRIDLNDKERTEFADQIRGVAVVDRPHVDELSNAILRLKKASLNRWEAKQVAGIVMDLRKTIKNLHAGVEESDDEEDEDDEEDSVNEDYGRLTRQDLRKLVDAKKMDTVDDVVDSLKKVLAKVTDQEMADFCKALVQAGKGEANPKQREHQEYMDVLAEAIRNLKRARLNKWEANQVSGILVSLRKTQYPDRWDNGTLIDTFADASERTNDH